MGQNKPTHQPKEAGALGFREVVLGFPKKITQEQARRCPQCAQPACLPACPLGVDIPGFIRFLRESDAVSALERIKLQNPFPAICGRICPAPCEISCIFYQDGSTISIRALERYASDFGQPKAVKRSQDQPNGKKVAIAGSGPSGLAAAYYLAQQGFAVMVFESMPHPGGLLRYGVPEFRLPQKVLDDQIAQVTALGVVIQTNTFLGRTHSVQELFMQGFDALLLAVGAGVPDFARLEGDGLGGVYYAEEFLMRLHSLRKDDVLAAACSMVRGTETVVAGGSPSAVDAARVAARLGQKVRLVFPGVEEQMDANADDVKAAVGEGVVLKTPVELLAIEDDGASFVKGLRCRRLEITEGPGGLVLEPVKDSAFSLAAQTVILAHGRRPNTFIREQLPQLRLNDIGAIWTDKASGQTSVEKVFACGNVATGAGPVVDAIASGKAAAEKIAHYLQGLKI